MLELDHISKHYQHKEQKLEVIQDLQFTLADHEFVAFVGPSGCGKSTLLRIIAGLAATSQGSVLLDGNKVIGPGRERGLVFQSFTLFPWLTVKENIAFGLDVQKMDLKKKEYIVKYYLTITGLDQFADFYPRNLSGGMQQRVAIARTLANNPKILLMDEPFGSLDSQTRSQMQEFLTQLWEKERPTILFITHDVSEAIFLADKVHVLTPRPMRIKASFEVPFKRPRTSELKYTEEFFSLERIITQQLQ